MTTSTEATANGYRSLWACETPSPETLASRLDAIFATMPDTYRTVLEAGLETGSLQAMCHEAPDERND